MLFEVTSFGILIALAGFFWAFAPSLRRDDDRARALITIIPALLGVRYLTWRLTDTVLPVRGDWVELGWVYFVYTMEVLAFVEVCIFLLIMSRANHESGTADIRQREQEAEARWPSVDVFIPTYNEGLDVLEKTIIGARAMDYPNFKVHVLDDGRREWLRDYCAAKGVGYHVRDDNSHAKAGNLNNGLARTDGELVAIFDADFVPHRSFLRRTAGMFRDPGLGILQTPQHFFNRDPVQMNLLIANDWPDEQRLFFDEMAASRDAWNVSFCCGSCSIIRRQTLDDIGGIPTESITEDILTTLAARRKGWTTRYLNERLSMGLAAESLDAFFVQRARWCQGGIQTLFLPEGPLGRGGMRVLDRILFFPFSWIVQYPVRMMALLVPIVYMLTGLMPLHYTSLDDLIFYQMPVLACYYWTMHWLVRGKYMPILSTAIGVFATFRLLPTVLSSLVRPFGKPFRVTPKGSLNAAGVDWISFACIMVFIGLTALGLVLNSIPAIRPMADREFFPVAAAWAVLNIVILILASLICFDVPRKRKEERFYVNRPVTVRPAVDGDGGSHGGMAVDVSVSGAFVRAPGLTARPGDRITVELPEVGPVPAEVVFPKGGGLALRFAWEDCDDSRRDALIAYLFCGVFSTEPPPDGRRRSLGRNLMQRFLGTATR